MKIVRNLTAIAAVATALTIAAQARASTVDSFYLTTEEGGTIISQSSAVEVFVTENSTTSATVEFEAPSAGGTIVDPVWINVSGTFTVSAEGYTGGTLASPTGPGTVGCCASNGGGDNFGTMTTGTGAQQGYEYIIFTLTATGGTTWANAADVLTPTTNSSTIAEYGKGFEAEENSSGVPQDAGFLAPTPLPAALPLFAAGLGAIGLLGRRRKRKAQALAA